MDATSNLLGATTRRVQSEPVLIGAQRQQVIAELGRCIADLRTVTVLQILNKDPSLARERMPVGLAGGVQVEMEFPLACLHSGLSAGYLFALQNGFEADRVLSTGCTLLEEALNRVSQRSSMEHHICLLLAAGCSAQAVVSPDCYQPLLANALSFNKQGTATISMLLDARANFQYSADLQSPFHAVISAPGWTDNETAAEYLKLMARFMKSGCDINRPSGSPKVTPLMHALGIGNPYAVRGLVHLGASTNPADLNGRELSTILESINLSQWVPSIREAVMQARMSNVVHKPTAQLPPGSASDAAHVAAPSAPVARRRSSAV